MRGINGSTVIFLAIAALNLTAFILLYCFRGFQRKGKVHPGIKMGLVFINLLLAAGLIFFSFNVGVTNYQVHSDRLPADFDGFKILQISDFHTGSFYGGTQKLIKIAREQKPDMIALTGDLIDESAKNISTVSELVDGLVQIAPIYSVTGNHDIWFDHLDQMEAMMEEKGVVLLKNKSVTMKRGHSTIHISGISDPDEDKYLSPKSFVMYTLGKLPPDIGYNILLFHRANLFDTIKGSGYQLVLSGHMHGGQIQIPFVGGFISPQADRRLFPQYSEGKWTESDTTMIVSRGLGNNVPVPRIFNPPEVVAVTLKLQ